jgi:hypothetical protein
MKPKGSPSMTVTATEAQEDIHPSRIQHTSAPSFILDMSSEFASEEDGVADEARAKPGKEEAGKVTTEKGSAGSTKGTKGTIEERAGSGG